MLHLIQCALNVFSMEACSGKATTVWSFSISTLIFGMHLPILQSSHWS